MGIGLFLAGTLCERLDGELSIETTEGQGTTVSLKLPLAASPPTTEASAPDSQDQPTSDMEKAS
jgi:K+-sensing histidine kinase KdpD